MWQDSSNGDIDKINEGNETSYMQQIEKCWE